jgi:hypothetical protein
LLGHFNWGNQGDTYLWFYLKNWGAILLWFVPAMIHCKKEDFDVMSGAFLLWFVVEIISFTPNTYDNNKLLYITYIFVCCLSADYGIDFLRSLKKASSRYLCMIGMVFLCTFSAVLTLCREVISDYTAYSSAQVEAAAFVEQNTSPTSRFLTNNRHVNEIAALAGRNVLNGAGTFLAMHGLYHTEYHEDFRTIYETPAVSADLIRTYDIDILKSLPGNGQVTLSMKTTSAPPGPVSLTTEKFRFTRSIHNFTLGSRKTLRITVGCTSEVLDQADQLSGHKHGKQRISDTSHRNVA